MPTDPQNAFVRKVIESSLVELRAEGPLNCGSIGSRRGLKLPIPLDRRMNYSVTLNDMNPIVEVDQASIAQHVSGNITGVIYWRSNDHCFPDDNWNDFVVVLLGWWTKAITRLLLGCSRSETFDFMDGPFSMLCTTATDVIDCQFIERRRLAKWARHFLVLETPYCGAVTQRSFTIRMLQYYSMK